MPISKLDMTQYFSSNVVFIRVVNHLLRKFRKIPFSTLPRAYIRTLISNTNKAKNTNSQ